MCNGNCFRVFSRSKWNRRHIRVQHIVVIIITIIRVIICRMLISSLILHIIKSMIRNTLHRHRFIRQQNRVRTLVIAVVVVVVVVVHCSSCSSGHIHHIFAYEFGQAGVENLIACLYRWRPNELFHIGAINKREIDALRNIARRQNEYVRIRFQLIDLSEQCVDCAHRIGWLILVANGGAIRGQRFHFIDEHKNECVAVLDHLANGAEQLLHQFAGLGKPFREQRVRIDLHQHALLVCATANGEFLRQCFAQRGLASARRTIQQNDAIPRDDGLVDVAIHGQRLHVIEESLLDIVVEDETLVQAIEFFVGKIPGIGDIDRILAITFLVEFLNHAILMVPKYMHDWLRIRHRHTMRCHIHQNIMHGLTQFLR
mmetsp:Transcript_15735/g.24113  ORF Transcript_15735/g.24113 Transcript_15735/m.24113 type:complete len:371 (+) Transcript_15735:355-1467(+)